MPTAELSSVLLERALDTYDDLASRHARRRTGGRADAALVNARRNLLVTRARSEDWLIPLASVVAVERLMAALDAIESVDLEVVALDRFCLDVLDAVERRSTGRRDRDREAESIGFTFS
jgi:hypothetical protein